MLLQKSRCETSVVIGEHVANSSMVLQRLHRGQSVAKCGAAVT